MFALLEHQTDVARCVPDDDTGRHVHWDFVIEVPGQEQLATWRLLSDPLVPQPQVPAERIADHHRSFLEYEGELSRAPGRVRRRDSGDSTIIHCAGRKLVADLHGGHLRGVYEIAPTGAGALAFRRIGDSAPG